MDFREALQAGKIGIGGASDHWTRLFGQKVLGGYAQGYAEGAIASFNDGAKDAPVDKLLVEILPVQPGTGDPSPENIRPISGWTGANVYRTGANIWNEDWEVGGLNGAGVPIASTNRIRSKTFCPIMPNTQYYCRSDRIDGGNQNVYYFGVMFYDASQTFISYVWSNNKTFTTPSNARYFKITSNSSVVVYGNTYNHDISVNYPDTDTAYHAYTGTTYPITWQTEAGTVYGGELDVTSGVLTVDKAMVDLGTLNWVRSSGGISVEGGYIFYSTSLDGRMAYRQIISSMYPYAGRVSGNNAAYGKGDKKMSIAEAVGRLYIRDDSYTDATSFVAAVTGQTLVYTLSTPLTYQLTPTEVTTLLGTNNIWADTGDVKVWYKKKR